MNFDDTDDAPALMAPYLDCHKALGVDKDWPAGSCCVCRNCPWPGSTVWAASAATWSAPVKDEAEQKAMIASSKVNDDCMAEFAAAVRPGVTELELAEKIKEITRPTAAPASALNPSSPSGTMPPTPTTRTAPAP